MKKTTLRRRQHRHPRPKPELLCRERANALHELRSAFFVGQELAAEKEAVEKEEERVRQRGRRGRGGEEKKEELLLQAMSFSWLRKLREEARGVAEEVIGIRPDFAVQWEQIMEDFGE